MQNKGGSVKVLALLSGIPYIIDVLKNEQCCFFEGLQAAHAFAEDAKNGTRYRIGRSLLEGMRKER